MNVNTEARDDLDVVPFSAGERQDGETQNHRRSSESEVVIPVGLQAGDVTMDPDLSFNHSAHNDAAGPTPDLTSTRHPWAESSTTRQREPFSSSLTGNALFRGRSNTAGGLHLFGAGGGRRRFGSTSEGTTRQASIPGLRYGRGQAWKTHDNSNNNSKDNDEEDDNRPKLVSLSDLIRKEDKVPTTLYEHDGDDDVVIDARGGDAIVGGEQALNGVTLSVQDAVQAAEHGNSIRLSKFLQDGGDVSTVSRLHHMRWSLLHLAAGSAMMGGRLSFANYRKRAEPDCNDGYATCVSELLAAGADPNVTSKHGGYTPLMSAALTGSKECCWFLLRAGAQVDREADDGRTAFHFAEKAKQVGAGDSRAVDAVMAVLRDSPKRVPRSPTWVRATIAERSCLEPEDSVPSVQVRWRVPSQASLMPSICGDVQRYHIKCWCRGKGREVIPTKTSSVDVPRRDFCRNQIIDRGIALRKNLALPQSQTASTIVHGLQAGEYYSFTVSCKAEVDGVLRQSPPSCKSKPLFIPESKEDHQWHLGGMLSMVTGNNVPSPGGATVDTSAAQAQARRGKDEPPTDVDPMRRGHVNNRSVSWAKDDQMGTTFGGSKGAEVPRDGDTPPRPGFSRTMPEASRVSDARLDINGSPVRGRSMSFTGATMRASDSSTRDGFWLPSSRASFGGTSQSADAPQSSSPSLSNAEGLRLERERYSFGGTSNVSPAQTRSHEPWRGDVSAAQEHPELAVRPLDRGYSYRVREQHTPFQDEGCTVS